MLVGIADQNDLWKQMKFISGNLRSGNEVFETYSLLGFNDRYIKHGNIFDILSSLSNCQANLFGILQVSNRLLFKFVCFEEDIIWIYAVKYFRWKFIYHQF